MTHHERYLKDRQVISDKRVKEAARIAKYVLTFWPGRYSLSHLQTNRLDIFNF